ncbi:MAG: peptide ABC transporter ATP-binding protein [Dehalococcoidales bacterium]|nr:peptide ABC transporter ATP-binding protein [Dehalococcoidales bacterium]
MEPNSTQNLLDVKNLEVEFSTNRGVVKALNRVNLEVRFGETVGLVGESGAGKSVLGRSIMQLLSYPGRVSGGEIFWNGEDLLKRSEKQMCELRSDSIAMVFQDPMTALNPLKKIKDQLLEAILLHQNVSREQARKIIIRRLRDVELPQPEKMMENYPHQLSGGMRQRVVIALALVNDPALIIADEPTTALDVTIQAQILELLKNLQKENNLSTIMITHNMAVVAETCSRVNVMYAGRIVESGKAVNLFDKPVHPYTQALLRSIIRLDNESSRLETIPGVMPDLINVPSGCAFHPRCSESFPLCVEKKPDLLAVTQNHFSACHLRKEHAKLS